MLLPMSNKCQYCGAPAGKSHICPYAPGGKYYKAPAQKKPAQKTVEVTETTVGTFVAETAPIPEEVFSSPAPAIKKPRAAKASELQAKADGVKPKATRPRSRAGLRAATLWLTPDELKRLQRAAVEHEVGQGQILAEGLALMLEGKYRV